MLHIVLVEPEIPQNCGNIARTCAATGCSLHLIRPLGFDISDKAVKRAGLDYWNLVSVHDYENLAEFFEKNKGEEMFFFSAKGKKNYTYVEYPERVFLIFGKESCGLDPEILRENYDKTLRIPMLETLRCLNLSNCAAIAVYEVLRRWNFDGFLSEGSF